ATRRLEGEVFVGCGDGIPTIVFGELRNDDRCALTGGGDGTGDVPARAHNDSCAVARDIASRVHGSVVWVATSEVDGVVRQRTGGAGHESLADKDGGRASEVSKGVGPVRRGVVGFAGGEVRTGILRTHNTDAELSVIGLG